MIKVISEGRANEEAIPLVESCEPVEMIPFGRSLWKTTKSCRIACRFTGLYVYLVV